MVSYSEWYKTKKCFIANFQFSLKYDISKVQENHDGMQVNGTHQLLVYASDINNLGEKIYTTQASREGCLEVNTEKTTYRVTSCYQNAGHNHNILTANKPPKMCHTIY
jgi:hypothetical protein